MRARGRNAQVKTIVLEHAPPDQSSKRDCFIFKTKIVLLCNCGRNYNYEFAIALHSNCCTSNQSLPTPLHNLWRFFCPNKPYNITFVLWIQQRPPWPMHVSWIPIPVFTISLLKIHLYIFCLTLTKWSCWLLGLNLKTLCSFHLSLSWKPAIM